MIVQITITRGECFLLKEMLPVWSKYADGFVFYVHGFEDDTVEYLESVKEKYNILSILKNENDEGELGKKVTYETDHRQRMYDEGMKFSKKLIVLDTDEYLDGSLTKDELEHLLDTNPSTNLNLQWVQYTSKNQVRVDWPWAQNFKVRVGHYNQREDLGRCLRHSGHIPGAGKVVNINPGVLYIAHLQWLDKRWVGVKQYFWKLTDYIARVVHKEQTYAAAEYDVSVNNFNWQYGPAPKELRIREDIFDIQDMKASYKLKMIVRYTNQYDIPNLGDWGMGIHEYAVKQKQL